MKQHKSNNQIYDEIYEHKQLTLLKIILFSSIFILIGFLQNFSPKESIILKVKSTLSQQQKCPITYSEVKMEWLLPKVIINSPIINGKCFNTPGKDLFLKNMRIYFTGPGIFPPGLKFGINLETESSKILLYPHISPFGQKIKIENSYLDSKLLASFFPKLNFIKGQLELNILGEIENTSISKGAIFIKSKNLVINETEFNYLVIPKLAFNHLSIKATLKNKKDLKVHEIILGDKNSPIKIKLKGKITLNQKRISTSKVDLSGEISFSDQFFNVDFTAVKTFLKKAQPKNGVYLLKLTGTLGQLDKPKFY